jgi:hypothetical protein
MSTLTKRQWVLKYGTNTKTKTYDLKIMEEILKMNDDLFKVIKDQKYWSEALKILNDVEEVNYYFHTLAIEVAKLATSMELIKFAIKMREVINFENGEVNMAFMEAEMDLKNREPLQEVLTNLEAKIMFSASF